MSHHLLGNIHTREAVAEISACVAALRDGEMSHSTFQKFAINPKREQDTQNKLCPALEALQFLVGDFNGEGIYYDGNVPFKKESVATVVAGGHALSVANAMHYSHGTSIYTAHSSPFTARTFVLIYVDQTNGDICALAVSDAGKTQTVKLQTNKNGSVSFSDQAPSYLKAERAWKSFAATPDGYTETLEIEQDGRRFEAMQVHLRHRSFML